jgi:hypothetical protein
MRDEVERPLSVGIAQGLMLSSAFVLLPILLLLSLTFEGWDLPLQIMYGVLLVGLPLTAVFMLVRKLPFAKYVSIAALVSIWAVVLRLLLKILGSGPDIEIFGGVPGPLTLAGLYLFLGTFVVGLPLLAVKLGFGERESSFFSFASAEEVADPLRELVAPVSMFEDDLINRHTEPTLKK